MKFYLTILKITLVFLLGNLFCPLFGGAFSLSETGYNWLITAEMPSLYTFRKSDDDKSLEQSTLPSGILLTVQTKYHFGAGIDYYSVAVTDSDENEDHSIEMQLLNISYMLDYERFEFMLGGGYGVSEVKGTYEDNFERGTPTQVLLQIGYIGDKNLMLVGSYRYILNQIEYKDKDYKLEAGGSLLSIGIGGSF